MSNNTSIPMQPARESDASQAELDMSPGSQLQRAREQAGMTCEELARRLCMSLKKLELLERDEYERLPGALYVRGYIRNACKELKADPAPVLEAYSGYCVAEEDSRALVEHVRRGPVISDKPKRGNYRGLALFTLVAVAGIFWWANGRNMAPPVFFADIPNIASYQQEEPKVAAVEQEPALIPGEGEDVFRSVAEEEPAAPPVPEAAEAVIAEAETPQQIAAVVEAAEAEAEADTDTASASVAQTGGGDLQLQFAQESWVEVADASGKTLLAKLQPAGSQVTLDGRAPFKLMLGNALGTTVRYRGEVVESGPIGDRRTRKLTVGE